MRDGPVIATAALLAGCATTAPPDPGRGVPIFASGQTVPVASVDDAADDPAIWVDPDDPAASLIVGTDKQAGLYVYGLDGAVRGFAEAGRVNNVGLASLETTDGPRVIVAASERNDEANAHVVVYELDTASGELTRLGRVGAGPGEAYGLCVAPPEPGGPLRVAINVKEGAIYELALALGGESVTAEPLRTMRVPSQPEGCVYDRRDGALYVGEEAAGVWRFDAGESAGDLVILAAPPEIVPDVEGLAIAPEGAGGGLLVVSSQGDSAFAAYALPDYRYVGRFYVAEGNGIDAVTETDGIEVSTAALGPAYPEGLMVVQDGATPLGRQNFKLIDWRRVRTALGLE